MRVDGPRHAPTSSGRTTGVSGVCAFSPIIKGGENIAPREVDDALHAHPDVIEAAAFAKPCPDYGQRVEAAVCLARDATVTPDDLIAHCRAKLGAFRAPERIHVLADLPRGPSGKVQRIRLAGML